MEIFVYVNGNAETGFFVLTTGWTEKKTKAPETAEPDCGDDDSACSTAPSSE
ncbi:MAG: hypothetical protein GWP91_08260 [Rhodobacterales bacterium]|nr:hypothetical protein [Rhodobacterales bacterium]